MPKSDTCRVCDELTIKINQADQEEENKKLTTQHRLHLAKAKGMQDSLKVEVERARNNPELGLAVLSMDLQQALPTPKLSCGPAFYKRKLWTFNFSIHNCVTDQGFMFMWDETTANRGSDEIGSSILKYIEHLPQECKHIVVYSDNCPGQNKNWNITALWIHLIRSKRFESIEHRFLVAGHTHLPSDRDFAKIEKFAKNRTQAVYDPEGWRQIVLKCNKRKPFHVTVMKQDDFVTVYKLVSLIRKTTKHDDRTALRFSSIYTFRFTQRSPETMFVKYACNDDFVKVCLKKRGRPCVQIPLEQKYSEELPINPLKFKDIQDLLPYIPAVNHTFYNSLRQGDTSEETNGNIELLNS